MKNNTIITILILLAIYLTPLETIIAKEIDQSKPFAYKLITKDGKIFQSLLLCSDWKQINIVDNSIQSMKINELKSNPFSCSLSKMSDQLSILIISSEQIVSSIRIYNLSGLVVEESKVNLLAGENIITKNLGKFPDGVYFLNIVYNINQILSLKFFK